MPGMPGGAYGGGQGGAGGGFGGGSGGHGGSGGAPGMPGMPGGSGSDDDDDLNFTLADFLALFNSGVSQKSLAPRESTKRHKIKVTEECADIEGVPEFINSVSPKTKKAWMAQIIHLSASGHKACAENLAEQLLLLKK